MKTADEIPTYIATVSEDTEKTAALEKLGAHVVRTDSADGKVNLPQLMKYLASEEHIDSILLEGGSELAYSALKSGIVNKVQVYMAPKIFGGTGAKPAVGGEGVALPDDAVMLSDPVISTIGEDILIEYSVGGE